MTPRDGGSDNTGGGEGNEAEEHRERRTCAWALFSAHFATLVTNSCIS